MKLPVVSGSEAARAFRKLGYEFDEQHGSHMILRHAEPPHRRLSVPNHKELAKGTLRTLIREAGLTVGRVREGSLGSSPLPLVSTGLPVSRVSGAHRAATPSGALDAGGPVLNDRLRGMAHASYVGGCTGISAAISDGRWLLVEHAVGGNVIDQL